MNKQIFRIFNPGGPKQDPKERRRGQLRRAQQTYRERKDVYTRNLERELGRTQANEALLLHRCQDLTATVEVMAGILLQHGIDPPPGLSAAGSYSWTNCTPHGSSNSLHPAHGDATTRGAAIEARNNLPPKADWDTPDLSWATPESSTDYASPVESWLSPGPQYQGGQSWATAAALPEPSTEVDQVTAGVEFVLKLEEPCLGHIHGDPAKPQEPNGHALTATSQILQVCGPRPPQDFLTTLCPSYKDAPGAILARLLSLSPDCASEGELTPAQAWNEIRCRPDYKGIGPQLLETLANKLRDAVKCHGFGAVLQQTVFEGLVFETLVVGRVF
ncbi:hypothetical protein GE09DRAFT_123944 [Coniochaeta sp. 2T2.1]|nr:hypothetical protein GE09DRAFT_123944 [Coniochaeta sp. 2T2.1]